MSPPVDSVLNDDQLPESADVVVIGGGIIGSSAAYYLARKGLTVTLVEKGRIGAEQSSRNWGWCRQQGRDRRELPLVRESIRLWEELQNDIATDLGFRRTGVLYVTTDPTELAHWERWVEVARQYQVHTRLLGPAKAAELTPGCSHHWAGGIHTPGDGRAEPARAAPAIARAARSLGVTVHQNCAARGLDTEAGRVTRVVTEQGIVRTRAVLCAAGAWASLFCRRHDIELPQLALRASVLRTEPVSSVTEGAIGSAGFCIRRRLDGGYTLALRNHSSFDITPAAFRYVRAFLPAYRQEGEHMKLRLGAHFFQALRWPRRWALDRPSPFEEVRVLDPAPDRRVLDLALTNLRAAYPSLGNVRMAASWAGMIDVTPDALPVISAIDNLPGLYLATGFSGHGFGIGPGAGRLVADLVNGDEPLVDPQPFRHSRMIDGTKLLPDTGL